MGVVNWWFLGAPKTISGNTYQLLRVYFVVQISHDATESLWIYIDSTNLCILHANLVSYMKCILHEVALQRGTSASDVWFQRNDRNHPPFLNSRSIPSALPMFTLSTEMATLTHKKRIPEKETRKYHIPDKCTQWRVKCTLYDLNWIHYILGIKVSH